MDNSNKRNIRQKNLSKTRLSKQIPKPIPREILFDHTTKIQLVYKLFTHQKRKFV